MRQASFSGTTGSGRVLTDFPTVLLESDVADSNCEITGSSAALNLWLWGRGPVTDLNVTGDSSLATYVRDVAAKST